MNSEFEKLSIDKFKSFEIVEKAIISIMGGVETTDYSQDTGSGSRSYTMPNGDPCAFDYDTDHSTRRDNDNGYNVTTQFYGVLAGHGC